MNKSRVPFMAVLAVSVMLVAAKNLSPQLVATMGEQGAQPSQNTRKVALLVLSYPSLQGGEGVENMSKAMGYALRLKKAGVEVAMLFDGSGLEWLSFFLINSGEAGRLAEESRTLSPEEKIRATVMLTNMMTSGDVAPEEKAKLGRMLVESAISAQPWIPSPEEKTGLSNLRKKLREAGIPMMASQDAITRKKLELALSSQRIVKAKSTEKGGLDISAYVLDGYQVWIF